MTTTISDARLEETIGRLAAEFPRYIGVFEQFRLDYCCGGKRTLRAACFVRQVDPQEVVQAMNEMDEISRTVDDVDWSSRSLTELADHIEQVHHTYLRRELPRLHSLVSKVANRHGERQPSLVDLLMTFELLGDELVAHMRKEEQILFPVIRAMEANMQPLDLPFGTVANPIRVMEDEHHGAGEALKLMRNITSGYTYGPDACTSYRGMMEGLKNLELDMHIHIHKEDNILFPRAQQLEKRLNGAG